MNSPKEILGDNGPLAEQINDFRARPMQQDLAETIYQAMTDEASLVCEAGTGTGKTFAYLVPALISGKKILVSTGTKHLQDQIFQKDLPTVRKALKNSVHASLLKGRANYLCLERYKYAHEVIKSPALLADLDKVNDWSRHTDSGDLSEVLPESAAIRPWVSSTLDNCLGQECDQYEQCYVLKARRKAAQADVIIVNHHLLLADMNLRETGFGELLPNVDMIIFDEAHQVPELASRFFGTNLSSRQCLELCNDTREAYEKEAWDVDGFEDITYEIEKHIRNFRALFTATDARVEWDKVVADDTIKSALETLYQLLMQLAASIESLSERGKELESCFARSSMLLGRVDAFLNDRDNEYVQWIEIRGKGFLLHQTPLNVSKEFQNHLQHYNCHAIYTSATLAVGENFKHFSEQLGLSEVQAKTWPSPFDYENQTLLYLPADMPLPNDREYTKNVIEKALPVLEASKGRAFLLFTSHRALKEAAELLKSKVKYPCYVQGEVAKMELLESFRNSENGILLGTSSFWEGVDVKGEALSCVIIDKLPFAMPDDPVLKARGSKMEEEGKNVFMEYQLPQAVISLKQGVGRLIRDANDYGVLMICDPRIRTKSYGRIFLRSLPRMKISKDITEIEQFYSKLS